MAARAEQGMKRKDLAAAAGLSYPYVAELENGGKQPSSRALNSLASALGMTPADLLRRAEGLTNVTPSSPDRPQSVALAAASPLRPLQADRWSTDGGEDELVARISSAVSHAVDQQLRDWLGAEIPRLVRDEVARALRSHR